LSYPVNFARQAHLAPFVNKGINAKRACYYLINFIFAVVKPFSLNQNLLQAVSALQQKEGAHAHEEIGRFTEASLPGRMQATRGSE
jgi:hypothetical protein